LTTRDYKAEDNRSTRDIYGTQRKYYETKMVLMRILLYTPEDVSTSIASMIIGLSSFLN